MKCPVCHKDMKVTKRDVSFNNNPEKKYDRVIYHCEDDDVWVGVEVPKKESNLA